VRGCHCSICMIHDHLSFSKLKELLLTFKFVIVINTAFICYFVCMCVYVYMCVHVCECVCMFVYPLLKRWNWRVLIWLSTLLITLFSDVLSIFFSVLYTFCSLFSSWNSLPGILLTPYRISIICDISTVTETQRGHKGKTVS
jgi:hypothetical protein